MPSIDFPFELPREAMLTVGDLPFPKVASGKVREIFDMGDALLMVATDRVSAFDVVMNEGLAGKGALLTQISLYWFEQANRIMAHHLVDNHSDRLDSLVVDFPDLKYRSMIVKKLKPLPIEAVVRGYLSGSGWKSYEQSGKLFEYELPQNLVESSRLKIPLFTATTKAATGHDMPVDCIEAAKLIGSELFNKVHALSLKLYAMGAAHSQKAKIILADTKFEFGTNEFGDLYLIDEVLTPDSSRYWPMDNYAPGGAQPSYDKQFIRDFLEKLDWDKSPPPPKLPDSVLQGTLERYKEAYISLIS
jgi:phosphoribosylaminoimidazole-succinocarboxamide synthase